MVVIKNEKNLTTTAASSSKALQHYNKGHLKEFLPTDGSLLEMQFIPADAVNGAPSSNSEGSMDPSFYRALKENDDRSAMSIMSGLETSFTGLTAGKNTVLHLAAALGHYSIIDLAQEAYDMVFAVNSKGDTPLHCAARGGHTEVVGYLIFSMRQSAPGVSLKTLQNERGNTPLHEAVGSNHMRAAAELMRADAGFGETVNRSGVSALYMAVEREDMGIVRMLLAFPDCSAGGPNGQTALHAAASRNLEITQLLLQERPGISRQVDANGSSPLHYAASIGDLGIINLLISHDATTAHLLDKDGLSPIHAAAAMGNTNAIDVLLKFCPDAFELTDIKGRNFLHVAILNKRSNVVKYALRNPDINDLFNESDSDGNTPLHLAVTRSNLEMVNLLLADKRTDTRAANHEGLTPLDLAYSLTGSSIHLRMHKIMDKLVSAGSQFGPQRIDLMTSKYQQKDEEQMNRCRSLANNLAIVSVLITTVTFAAAFTLPGGYANEHGPNQGMAILSKNAAFQAFIISDTVAMVSSITVTCLLIYTVSFDHDVRVHSLSTAMKLFWVALGAMVVAFGTGTYVVLAPNCQWLAILVCSIACSVPLIAWMIASWPAFDPLGFGTSKWKVTEGNGEKKSITLEVKKVVASKMPPMTIIDFSTPHYLASENI